MFEHKDNQDIKPGESTYYPKKAGGTSHAPEVPPAFITKKWLCWRLDLIHLPCGRPNYKALYQLALTPEVLSAIGTAEGAVRRRGFTTFNREQTVALIRILDL